MITLAILAGGQSRRMGQDKSVMLFRGEMLIRRVMERVSGLQGEVLLIAPKNQVYESLEIKIVEDLLPGRGSLGGLYTAMVSASHPFVAALACDMPFVNADLLSYQRGILEAADLDVVVPSSGKGLEPLHAIYRRDTCGPFIRRALEDGEQRLISWFPSVKVRVLDASETRHFDPRGLMFMNVNTPEELCEAEKLAGENTI